MCAAVGIAAHFFEFEQTEPFNGFRHGNAHACMVLMVAGAVELDMSAVQKETVVRIERNGAEAAADIGHIQRSSFFIQQRGFDGVENGGIQIPECHIGGGGHIHGDLCGPEKRSSGGCAFHRGDHIAVRRNELRKNFDRAVFHAGIADLRLKGNVPDTVRALDRVGIDPVRQEVTRGALDQPDVPVKSAAFVPPSFVGGFRIDPDGDGVEACAVFRHRGHIAAERGVAALAGNDRCAVEVNFCQSGCAFKEQFNIFSPVGVFQFEVTAVPHHAPFAAAAPAGNFCDRSAGSYKVVRQVYRLPVRIIEIGRDHAGGGAGFGLEVSLLVTIGSQFHNIAIMKQPTAVETQFFP